MSVRQWVSGWMEVEFKKCHFRPHNFQEYIGSSPSLVGHFYQKAPGFSALQGLTRSVTQYLALKSLDERKHITEECLKKCPCFLLERHPKILPWLSEVSKESIPRLHQIVWELLSLNVGEVVWHDANDLVWEDFTRKLSWRHLGGPVS